jgi:hypothetical protein
VGTADESEKCLAALGQILTKRAGKSELAAR